MLKIVLAVLAMDRENGATQMINRGSRGSFVCALIGGWILTVLAGMASAQESVSFEGFLPFVGLGLTDEFQDSTDPSAASTFFITEPSNSPGGQQLGPGNSAYYDIALFDSGAATHILTRSAHNGFDIDGKGFDGTNVQAIGGATGVTLLEINDPLGVYMGGLADRTSTNGSPNLVMNRSQMRGQTSFATLSAPTSWELPNIIGLPMVAQHAVHIKNSEPVVFEMGDRTVRTPQIDLFDLGSSSQGITRRAPLILKPAIGFVQGPIYVQNLDFTTLVLHENPLSPSVIENGGLFMEVDMDNGNGNALEDTELLFDTGASLTVISEQTAVRLGFDPVLDDPDFELAVEGSGGITEGIPGFFLETFRIDTIGGSFELSNVPVAVLDVTNPSDPGNVVDGIIGMNLFNGRDLVIDANPSIGQGGTGPSLYISDKVTQSHVWGTTATSGDWIVDNSWDAAGVPNDLWDATVANVRGSDQEAVLSTSSTVFRTTISGGANAEMTVRVATGGNLIAFADIQLDSGGRLHLDGGTADAQYIQIDGGRLTGGGRIFVGSGPLDGSIRNLGGGVIAPGDENGNPIGHLEIVGDLANIDGTLEFDLGGTVAGVSHDSIEVSRIAFLDGILEVNLADLGMGTFTPNIGDTFTLITADGISGRFEELQLPGGFDWNVTYSNTLVRLQVTGLAALLGDFNSDGTLDCADINLLTTAVANGGGGAFFDLTGDGVVDGADIENWVTEQRGTLMGDANLDGVVDTSDFNVWNGGKFTSSSEWCSGDFNGDGSVDISDFNVWNSNKFRSADSGASTVPEPTAGLMLLFMAAWLVPLGVRRVRR